LAESLFFLLVEPALRLERLVFLEHSFFPLLLVLMAFAFPLLVSEPQLVLQYLVVSHSALLHVASVLPSMASLELLF
jgi:hypothetical protein